MSARRVGFWVDGVPIPQGSKKIGRNPATGRPLIVNDNDAVLKPWRELVDHRARAAMKEARAEKLDVPCAVELVFWMPRPASHFKRSGELKASAPAWPAVKPDVDKLERAVFDSLTSAGVWADDGRAVVVHKYKRYATPAIGPGVEVLVSAVTA